MKNKSSQVIWICCSVLEAEVKVLHQKYWPDVTIYYPDSMLHMEPEKLSIHLESLLGNEIIQGNRVIFIYGDCCSQMSFFEKQPGVVRTRGKNCCELLLGYQEYRKLLQNGAFFLLPEWVMRWEQVFQDWLGLNQTNASSMMRDVHRKLIYLDTGISPVPETSLQECSLYCGLPYEILATGLEGLRLAIEDSITRLDIREISV